MTKHNEASVHLFEKPFFDFFFFFFFLNSSLFRSEEKDSTEFNLFTPKKKNVAKSNEGKNKKNKKKKKDCNEWEALLTDLTNPFHF